MDQIRRELGIDEDSSIIVNDLEINVLTGLYLTHTFFKKADEYLEKIEPDTHCMVAIDLEHFRLFNKIYGREQGDCLLKKIAELLKAYRMNYGAVIGYLSGDNFGMLTYYDKGTLKQLRRDMAKEIRQWSNTVGFLPAVGIYPIHDTGIPAATMYDRATIALSQVMGNYTRRSCEYSTDMEEAVEEELKLLSEIQDALNNEEFTFYIQPQCDISSGKIVGGESLVRWIHPTKGLISPGVFIPVLEKNGFIATLDRYMWKKVCEWLRAWIDSGHQPVPISLNVSRIDIFSMDVPQYLAELLKTYDLPAKLLKIEITESAYAESNDKIIRTVKQLRDADLLVMMDDFGCGYSSLNMLKSVSVDVLKLDMRFLEINEEEEARGIGILESVVNMARQMQMPIIVEGVETQKQESFLLKLGCRYSQGYYYYKPMPIEDFEKLISNEYNLDLDGIWCKRVESIHISEFFDKNLFSDSMMNNILGPSAYYDVFENSIEITRVNNQYYELAGISAKDGERLDKKLWIHVREDDRQILASVFAQAYENPERGAEGYIHFVRVDGIVLWVLCRIFFLRERDGHKLFYGTLTDLTDLYDKKSDESLVKDVVDLTENQYRHMKKYYGGLPYGYAVAKIILDDNDAMKDYEIVYGNHELSRRSGGNIERLHFIVEKAFGKTKSEMFEKAYRAAFYGERTEYSAYSPMALRYFNLVFVQFQYGYVGCMILDKTQEHIYEKTMQYLVEGCEEIYFVHLQDHYARMVYPDENQLLERYNYEELIERHLTQPDVYNYDEKEIREFLSIKKMREVLSEYDRTEYKYHRSVKGKGEEWYTITVTVCDSMDGEPQTAIVALKKTDKAGIGVN